MNKEELKKKLREARKNLQDMKNMIVIDYGKFEDAEKVYEDIGFNKGKETSSKLLKLLESVREKYTEEAQKILEEMYEEEEKLIG